MMIPTCLVKILELMLSVACVALLALSYDLTDPPSLLLAAGTYGGYVIVLSGEIIGEFISAGADAHIAAWWSGLGAALHAGSGARALAGWRGVAGARAALARAGAVLALAQAALLAVDALLALCAARGGGSSRDKSVRSRRHERA
ncbi:uncharacterized protein LOC119691537 isoform X1 [Plutella xylostella]|uniref:uncharacterized protein LOC119691537 isoform X1 n=1 Tax=Plutella xylostella TaxID=51655 RepID=UPI002032F358|nr:uncharacterized protein LOC119691537 isoform X1 [Plutella xylostella]